MREMLYFTADWCGPCKMMRPIVSQIAEDNPGINIKFVNIDNDEDITSKYDIQSVPTFVIQENGKEIRRHIGAVPRAKLESFMFGESNG